jgi:hypothetical protein
MARGFEAREGWQDLAKEERGKRAYAKAFDWMAESLAGIGKDANSPVWVARPN